MIIATLLSLTFILLCVKMRKSHRYWKNRNVLHIRPWPFFGFVAPSIIQYKAYPWVLKNAYDVFPEQRFFGLYQFLTPYLLIRQPKLIKRIAIDEFETFSCNAKSVDSDSDPILMKNREQWEKLGTLLETMLSNDEPNNTFWLMQNFTKNFFSNFSQKDVNKIELKDFCAKFTNDAIAATIFGHECDSLKEPNNEFYSMTKYTTDFNFLRTIKLFLYGLSPRVMKFFKFSLVDNRTKRYYGDLIRKNAQKPQLLQLHLEEYNEENSEITTISTKVEIIEDNVLAQTIQFLFFGFKTVSAALLFVLYELSVNVEIQEKLIKEIDKAKSSTDGVISLECLKSIEYLDMVVSESLRKWPPTVSTDRKSDKVFIIESTQVWEETTKFDAGTLCLIPIFAIHRDCRYFSNPDVFDPERFSTENKKDIQPFTYMPFGVGARSCIGSQFAVIQLKIFLFYLLSQFKVVKVDKSRDLVKLSKTVFQLVPEGRLWIGFEPRQSEKV